MQKNRNKRILVLTMGILTLLSGCKLQETDKANGLLMIKEQGSFTVGGSVVSNPGTFDPIARTPEGQTFHGDHAYIVYQIPDKARKLPCPSRDGPIVERCGK